jgi:hypothetical protein
MAQTALNQKSPVPKLVTDFQEQKKDHHRHADTQKAADRQCDWTRACNIASNDGGETP